jgi:hypothetical protein
MAKKLKFGEDGQVAETIEGIEPEMKSLVKLEPKKQNKQNKIEKRKKLMIKKVNQEKTYHNLQFGNTTEATEAAKVPTVAEAVSDTKKKKKAKKNKKEPKLAEDVIAEESNEMKVESTEKSEIARDAAYVYLASFVNDKANWKFQKVRQTWILRNLYYQHQIDNEHFNYCLKYMANMGERAKKETVDEAKILLLQENHSVSQEDAEEETAKEVVALDITDTIRKRAKKIIKLL